MTTTRLTHPTFDDVHADVAKDDVKAWKAAGWKAAPTTSTTSKASAEGSASAGS